MEELSKSLKKAANDYAAALGELDTQINDRRFSNGSFFSAVKVNGDNTYKTVRDALIDMGIILLDDEKRGVVLAMLKGGVGKLAPVLLLAKIDGSNVSLGAYSREGLIRQHIAKNAIESLKKTLQGVAS